MITKKQIIEYASTLEGAAFDSPFTDDFDTVVLRHGRTRRWFGLYFSVRACKVGLSGDADIFILNLKCEPNLAVLLREKHDWLIPAYHMNKTHWLSVLLPQTDDLGEVQRLIYHSYSLTEAPKKST